MYDNVISNSEENTINQYIEIQLLNSEQTDDYIDNNLFPQPKVFENWPIRKDDPPPVNNFSQIVGNTNKSTTSHSKLKFINKEEKQRKFSLEVNNDFDNTSKQKPKKSRFNKSLYFKESQKNKAKKLITLKELHQNQCKIFLPGRKDNYASILINSGNIIENILRKRCSRKKDRKYNSDNIRRKIKNRFHKALNNAVNRLLKEAKSEYLFQTLSIKFIQNVTKKKNREILNMTFKQIYSKDFGYGKKSTSKKFQNNIKTIKYLELKENKLISENSNYNNFKNMKYIEIYEEYLNSRDFEKEIDKIIEEENEDYPKQYINLAKHLIEFYSSDKN